MRKTLVVAALASALFASNANAGGFGFFPFFFHPHHVHTVTTTVTTSAPKAAPVAGSSGQVWSCVMNPAAALICVVVVGITVQTVKEIRAGCTNDIGKAKFWMPYPCRRDVVITRG
jgi:hypothetical protein